MKLRMTVITVAVVVLGALGIVAFTAAQPVEFIYAKFGVDMNGDGSPDELYDVWTDGVPGGSSEIVEVTPMPPEQNVQKFPGLARFENVRIRFEPGHLPATLASWHQKISLGQQLPYDATLVITGLQGETLSTYRLLRAWPCAIRFAQTRVGFRADAAEEVELAVEQSMLVAAAPPNPGRK